MSRPDHAPQPTIRAVLFDLGGVLVRLDSLENVLGPAEIGPDEIWNRWILSPAVSAFERGACTVEDFAAALVSELGLQGSPRDLIERFTGFPRGLFPGAVAMVEGVPAGVVTAILSNTNALHWQHQPDAARIRTLCDRNYLSFRLGVVKPDRAIFDHAVADLGFEATQVLFIDDNAINVEGARAAGLVAEQAKGPDQAGAVLQKHRLA